MFASHGIDTFIDDKAALQIIDRNLIQAIVFDCHESLADSGIRIDRQRSDSVFIDSVIDADRFNRLGPDIGPLGNLGATGLVTPLDEIAIDNGLLVVTVPSSVTIDVVHEIHAIKSQMQVTFVESDVRDIAIRSIESETRVGGSDVIHEFLQDDALTVETVAPSQSLVGLVPVDAEHGFILAFTNPIEDFRRVNLGFFSQRIHGSDFFRPYIDPVFRIGNDAAGLVAPFHIIAVNDGLLGIAQLSHFAIDDVHPPHSSQTEVEITIIEVNVVQPVVGAIIAEAVVSSSDIVHHRLDGDRCATEAVAPGQSRIRLVPVDDKDYFVFTFANPIADVGRVDSSILLGKQVGREKTKDSKKE